MTIFKKAAAILCSAAIFFGGLSTAYAENPLGYGDPGVSLIDPQEPDSPNEPTYPDAPTTPATPTTPEEPGVPNVPNEPNAPDVPTDPDTPPQSSEPSDAENRSETAGTSESPDENSPQSGVDLSDTEYTPIDVSGYTKWDGKTKMEKGVNYYIDSTVKVKKKFTVPAGSEFVVCAGASLNVYGSGSFGVKGKTVIEPKAAVIATGPFTVYSGGGLENFGSFSATKSSVIKIQSEFIVRHGAKAVISGQLNIYKSGVYLNYGKTSLTKNSITKITGELQTPEDGSLICEGYMGITINGRSTQAGLFTLTGEFVNSGVLIFEKSVRFYKSKSARFAVSKSSRLIDYRHGTDTTIGGDKPEEKPEDKPDDKDEDLGQTTDTGIKGIDVSYAQGAIDWKKVKAAGIEFAFIRASRGVVEGSPMAVDRTFEYNIVEASKNGINVGVYHYLYASTTAEAKKEAKFFLKTIEPYKITYPVVLDIEEEYQAKLGKKKLTAIAKAFLDEISAAGYYAMLYSNKYWLTHNLDMEKLSDYDVWLAQWYDVPTYEGDFGVWQYSCKGIVSGIDVYVDLDLSYKNYAKIIKEGNYNHLN